MTTLAVLAIVVAALEFAGGVQELVVQGILNNQRDPLIGGTLGAVAGVFLLLAGIGLFRGSPTAGRMARVAVGVSLPVYLLIGFAWHLAGWPARVLGIVVPLLLLAATTRAAGRAGAAVELPHSRLKNMLLLISAIGLCFMSISGVDAQELEKPIQLRQAASRPGQVKRLELDRNHFLSGQRPNLVRLIYDQAHGEQPPPGQMDTIARKLGLEIQTSARPLNAEALKGARILYLRAPSNELAAAETEAIVAFVKGGGSLLLVLDEERRQSLERTGVNNLTTPFGIKLTPDTAYLHNCGGIAKAGEINKADRELPFSGGRAVEGGTPFAFQLDKDGKPQQPFGAYKRLDNGARIVVLGEGMAPLFLGVADGVRLTGVPNDPTRTTYWGKDSAIFMEELLTWLSR